jgi:hypothetical protein
MRERLETVRDGRIAALEEQVRVLEQALAIACDEIADDETDDNPTREET